MNSSLPSSPAPFTVSSEPAVVSTPSFKPLIDELWRAFGEVGIEDGYDIVEQVTLLLFVRRLDVLQTTAENKARRAGASLENPLFDAKSDVIRWSKLKNAAPDTMFELFESKVVQQVREFGDPMSDVRFTIPSPSALSRMIDLVDRIPYADPETNGAVYNYLISKITTRNSSGGFPTPRHLIDFIVKIVDPRPRDTIADPASGSGGFLAAAGTHLRKHHPNIFLDALNREHFEHKMFHGIDNDPAFARMTRMNLLLHGIVEPDTGRRDSLAAMPNPFGPFTLVLTNPPFNGSVERSALDGDLYREVRSRTKAMLFVGRVLSLLQAGGRAAVIVPEGMLFGTRTTQVALRKSLVDDHKLDAVVKIPSTSCQPFSSTQTAILFFTKTGVGGTDKVWFYDVRADGFSLDMKRARVADDDLPDALARWKSLGDPRSPELSRSRTEQSFLVSREEIASNDYILTFNGYRAATHADEPIRPPAEILADIRTLNSEIERDLVAIEERLH